MGKLYRFAILPALAIVYGVASFTSAGFGAVDRSEISWPAVVHGLVFIGVGAVGLVRLSATNLRYHTPRSVRWTQGRIIVVSALAVCAAFLLGAVVDPGPSGLGLEAWWMAFGPLILLTGLAAIWNVQFSVAFWSLPEGSRPAGATPHHRDGTTAGDVSREAMK